MSSPRRRGSREYKDWIPACAGMTEKRRGNDKSGGGNDSYDHSVIPVKTGIQETCHPLEGGDPGIILTRFPPARE
ncbi:MAG: hypothetical protein SFT93_03070 [Rickettsiaceae bacterium]|nr:hypothetical protein [Rickettsiaceae bacterium]